MVLAIPEGLGWSLAAHVGSLALPPQFWRLRSCLPAAGARARSTGRPRPRSSIRCSRRRTIPARATTPRASRLRLRVRKSARPSILSSIEPASAFGFNLVLAASVDAIAGRSSTRRARAERTMVSSEVIPRSAAPVRRGRASAGVVPRLLVAATLAGLSLAAAWGTPARAETYPDRPIRLVIPFSAGGPNDLIARPLTDKMAEVLGQPFVIENRGGANGMLGATVVAKAPPDGYTLLMSTGSVIANAAVYAKPTYDAIADFAPVTLLAQSYGVVLM